MSDTARKPLPIPSDLARPFWKALRVRELHLQRCTRCGHYSHPPKVACPACHATELAWTRVADTGTLYTYTIVHRAPVPAFRAEIPYPVGLVDIDGTNVRLLSSLVVPPETIRIGMRMRVDFDDVAENFTLFRFKPIEGGGR
jgi:hypothetical protein